MCFWWLHESFSSWLLLNSCTNNLKKKKKISLKLLKSKKTATLCCNASVNKTGIFPRYIFVLIKIYHQPFVFLIFFIPSRMLINHPRVFKLLKLISFKSWLARVRRVNLHEEKWFPIYVTKKNYFSFNFIKISWTYGGLRWGCPYKILGKSRSRFFTAVNECVWKCLESSFGRFCFSAIFHHGAVETLLPRILVRLEKSWNLS